MELRKRTWSLIFFRSSRICLRRWQKNLEIPIPFGWLPFPVNVRWLARKKGKNRGCRWSRSKRLQVLTRCARQTTQTYYRLDEPATVLPSSWSCSVPCSPNCPAVCCRTAWRFEEWQVEAHLAECGIQCEWLPNQRSCTWKKQSASSGEKEIYCRHYTELVYFFAVFHFPSVVWLWICNVLPQPNPYDTGLSEKDRTCTSCITPVVNFFTIPSQIWRLV